MARYGVVMKRIILAMLVATGCGGDGSDVAAAMDQFRCGGVMAGGDKDVRVYAEGAVFDDGSAWLYAKVRIDRGEIGYAQGFVAFADSKASIAMTVGGRSVVVQWRMAEPGEGDDEITVRLRRDESYSAAGLCGVSARDHL